MAKHYGVPSRPEPENAEALELQHLIQQWQQGATLLANYDKESLSIFEPQEYQREFFSNTCRNVLITGGNQSGKTLASAIDFARAVTNQDPHQKYPKTGLAVLIGFGWKHIGNVFYPKLFKPGAFKIIRDKKTLRWRAFRPWEQEDDARKAEAEDAPPLISTRFYDPKDIAWEYRGQDQFVKVRLNTGWEIWAFSSEADPAGMQGFAADIVWIDEDVDRESWIDEAQARLIMRNGRLIWSAMPHSRNARRSDMSECAQKAKEDGVENPVFVEFSMPFVDNQYIPPDTKKQKIAEWSAAGDDVLRMRAYGLYTFNDQAMYPSFHVNFHGYKRENLPNREVPYEWTRFAAIDPGSQVCAVVFGAIPPDNSMCLVYDELRLERCDAYEFGESMQRKCRGYEMQAFIIDAHGARLRDIGGGLNVWDQYQNALSVRGVTCNASGSSFSPGVDKPISRAEAVRLALRCRSDETAYLRILVEDNGTPSVPHLVKSIQRFRKKKDKKTGMVLDEADARGDVHHAQCLEYLLSYHSLKYVAPQPQRKQDESTEFWLKTKEWLKNFGPKHRSQRDYVYLGPTSSLKESA